MNRKLQIIQSYPVVASCAVAVVLALLPIITMAAGSGIQYKLTDYTGIGSIEELMLAILRVFIVIATPVVVFFIIYAGFLYVTARGNAAQVQQATRAVTYAVIGGVLVFGAVALSVIIGNVVSSFTTG